MQLLLVGVSHRTAPIELRERLDFSARGVDRALTALSGSGAHPEATIVSTCNRVELYVGCHEPDAARTAITEMNGALLDGRQLRVNEAEERQQRYAGRPQGGGSRW